MSKLNILSDKVKKPQFAWMTDKTKATAGEAKEKATGDAIGRLVRWATGAEDVPEESQEAAVNSAIYELSDWAQARKLGSTEPLFPKPAQGNKSAVEGAAGAILASIFPRR